MHRGRNMVLPKSLIGKAIECYTKLWSSLITYLENGNYQIDNNAIENKIRPVAIGRKNYLFAGSHQGAKRAAMFYTFFACCKLNDVNPEKWLNKVLEVIANYPCNKLHVLFPGTLEVQLIGGIRCVPCMANKYPMIILGPGKITRPLHVREEGDLELVIFQLSIKEVIDSAVSKNNNLINKIHMFLWNKGYTNR